MSIKKAISNKMNVEDEKETKTFPDKQRLRKFVASTPALDIPRKNLQAKRK